MIVIIQQQQQQQQQQLQVRVPLLLLQLVVRRKCCCSIGTCNSNSRSRIKVPAVTFPILWNKTNVIIRNAPATTLLQSIPKIYNFTTTTTTTTTTTSTSVQQQTQQSLSQQRCRKVSTSSLETRTATTATTTTTNDNDNDNNSKSTAINRNNIRNDNDNDNNDSSTIIITNTSTKSTTKSRKSNNNNIISLENIETKELVTSLLQSTYTMMKQNSINGIQQSTSIDKYNNTTLDSNTAPPENLPKFQHQHIIAYSGGIDSTLVAKLIQECYTSLDEVSNDNTNSMENNNNYFTKTNNTILAVMGISNAVSIEQQLLGKEIAVNELQIPYTTIPTNEGSDQQYILNNGTACYTCKSYLYNTIQSIHTKYTTTNSKENNNIIYSVSLYNGTNKDDLQDTTRVGLIAANEYNVHSPISTLTKQQIRQVAYYFNLSNYNLVSNPCLRSRLQINSVHATSTNLQIVDTAERIVKQYLSKHIPNFSIITTNIRVRLVSTSKIYIEIDQQYLNIVSQINWYTILNDYNNTKTTTTENVDNDSNEINNSNNNDKNDMEATTETTTTTTTTTTTKLKSKDEVNNIQLNFSSIVVRPFKSGSISKITDATKKLQQQTIKQNS